jgi:hypothetical protein
MSRGYISQLQNQDLSPDLRAALIRFANLNLLTPSAVKLALGILALDPLKRKMHLYWRVPSSPARSVSILLDLEV